METGSVVHKMCADRPGTSQEDTKHVRPSFKRSLKKAITSDRINSNEEGYPNHVLFSDEATLYV